MKVSYVGNFSVPYSTETHIAKAWENLGHTVERIPEQNLDWDALEPLGEIFMWTRTAGFDPPDKQTQANALKRIDVPTVGYHLDRWWGLDREWWIDDSPFFGVDLLCTADGGHDEAWRAKGINHAWFPPAILSDEMKPGIYRTRFKADVGFVGNLTDYGHKEWAPYRRELYSILKRTFGTSFKVFPGQGPQIRGRDLADLYASVRVLVGDSCLVGNPSYYWSDRVPETLGRGGFLIHPHVIGLEEEFPDLMTYTLGDFSELVSKIQSALDAPSIRLENTIINRAHVAAFHTYEQRLARLLDLV